MDPTFTLCTDCLDVFEGEPFMVEDTDATKDGHWMERPVCPACYAENHEKSWRDLG